MNVPFLILIPGLRHFPGVAQEDDVQGDLPFRHAQQLPNPLHRTLLGMDAAPDGAKTQVYRPEQDVFCGGAAVLDPVVSKLHGKGSGQIPRHNDDQLRLVIGKPAGLAELFQGLRLRHHPELPGLPVAGAGSAHGRMEQLLDQLLRHSLLREFSHTSALFQHFFQFHIVFLMRPWFFSFPLPDPDPVNTGLQTVDGAGDDAAAAPLFAAVVGIENNGFSLRGLEASLHGSGDAQILGGHHFRLQFRNGRVHRGLQINPAFLVRNDFGCQPSLTVIGVLLPVIALGSLEVHVPVDVHRLLHLGVQIAVPGEGIFNILNVFFVACRMAVEVGGAVGYPLCLPIGIRAAHEDVLIEPVIAAIDEGGGHDGGGMGEVIRGGAVQHIPVEHIAQHQVVDVGAALGGIFEAVGRGKDVVVHEIGPVGHLHHQIPAVVAEQVAADPGALGLPVKPHTQGAVVEVIVPHLGIDGSVELDAADFPAEELVLGGDAVNFIAVNVAEDAAQMTHDAVLTAVVDHVVPHHMGADALLAPAHRQGLPHRLILVGVAGLSSGFGEEVVPGFFVLAQADAAAFGVVDVVVFDDPTLGPVGADESRLIPRGGREGSGCLGHFKAGDGDVVAAALPGIEDALSHVDLRELLVGVCPLEVGPEGGGLPVNLGIPLIAGVFPIHDGLLVAAAPGIVVAGFPGLRLHDLLQAEGLEEGNAVQVHISQMDGGIGG